MLGKNIYFLATSAFGLADAVATLTPIEEIKNVKQLSARQTCNFGPGSRSCWDDTHDISTDSETSWPNADQSRPTVKYTLEISEKILSADESPDGIPVTKKLINGTFPGPTLNAKWGDVLEITVINNMPDNGTSIHWHGIVQQKSNTMDGVNGVTECPITPNGGIKVYKFQATQHGTTWYHSHFSAQYGDGVVGSIVIEGPASADYDIDLGPLPMTDYYYKNIFDVSHTATTVLAAPPAADNGLINGKNTNTAGGGQKSFTPLTPGKKHRLRLINTSIDNGFYVSLDNHNLTVIAADFVPLVNYTTTWLFVGIGQRYDVIINADRAEGGNYLFRTSIPGGCGTNKNAAGFTSVFQYGSSLDIPTNAAPIAPPILCNDDNSKLVPYTSKSVPTDTFSVPDNTHTVSGAIFANGSFSWNIDGPPSMDVDWSVPTLSYVKNGTSNWPAARKVYDLPQGKDGWVYWIINNLGANAHPIHLHGHDFHILGAKLNAQFTSTSPLTDLNFVNPPRRDVAMLPANGYLVLTFTTDNPGAWLMHCHIAFHVSQGLAVQFLERKNEIKDNVDLSILDTECPAWDAFYQTSPYRKDDSGL